MAGQVSISAETKLRLIVDVRTGEEAEIDTGWLFGERFFRSCLPFQMSLSSPTVLYSTAHGGK